MLEHGGNLQQAAARFKRPVNQWLDLSSGINPRFYPVAPISENAWHRLPEVNPDLCAAAEQFYAAPKMLAVAGTQAAIQALPRLRREQSGIARVIISAPSYAEHAYQWRAQQHHVTELAYQDLDTAIMAHSADSEQAVQVVVVVNPNNPTGERIAAGVLLRWAEVLSKRNGWLIVDEAFADTFEPFEQHSNSQQHSLAPYSERDGIIVLRSVGKFFGLAGLRLGFVAAAPTFLRTLENLLGPWAVSGPAQEIALSALNDHAWQTETRHYLNQQGQRLQTLLVQHGFQPQGCDLFQWCSDAALDGQTEALFEHFAQHGIWIRLFLHQARGLRFGLPPDENGWQRLELALDLWKKSNHEEI